jgi:hypothetical protein
MSIEIGTPYENRRHELEEAVIDEAIRILTQTFDAGEFVTLPWVGMHYKTENREAESSAPSEVDHAVTAYGE